MDLFQFSIWSISPAFIVWAFSSLPCSFWVLREPGQWVPRGRTIKLFSCLKQSSWEPTSARLWRGCSATSSVAALLRPVPALSCSALSISWPFLGFASRIKPSIPPGHVKTPHKENNERAMGPCALPLCPVHSAAHLPPGGHPVSCGREPQCPQAVAKFVLSWLQAKWKKELIFFCPWLFSSKPQLIQYWGFPATTLTAPERTLAFVLGCESAFCMSPSHTCAQTELPGHPRLSLPCSSPAFLLPFAQAGLGFHSQNYWWGLNLTVCARAALPGLLTPPR